ncbi:hypothetical protein DsansV1_C05g0057801 [Dioscorea sansibarensis]
MESNKVESKMNMPCSKKGKEGNFFDKFKSQFDVFMNTSMEQHRICLQRSFNDFRDFVKHKREELSLKASNAGGNGGETDGKGKNNS